MLSHGVREDLEIGFILWGLECGVLPWEVMTRRGGGVVGGLNKISFLGFNVSLSFLTQTDHFALTANRKIFIEGL